MENKQTIKENEEILQCELCGKEFKESEGYNTQLYSSAFDSVGCFYAFCCDSCEDSYIEDMFYCDECGRRICCTCGHNVQYRFTESEEPMCLRCYESQLYKEGITKNKFEGNLAKKTIPGMFFNDGDLESEDFEQDESIFIRSKESIRKTNERCLELIDEGYLVIIEFRSLSAFGNEGHIKIWTKKNND